MTIQVWLLERTYEMAAMQTRIPTKSWSGAVSMHESGQMSQKDKRISKERRQGSNRCLTTVSHLR